MTNEKNVATQDAAMASAVIKSTAQTKKDTWNNRLRSVTMQLEKLIPKVGGLVSFLTGICWPSRKASIWDLVIQQVTELVDRKILEQELRERAAEILALKSTLEMYSAAKLNEKGLFLHNALEDSEKLYQKFSTSANAIHMMPFAIITAEINLAVLRERYDHGIKLYREDNKVVWGKDLKEKHADYKKFFLNNYKKWCVWRESQITTRVWKSHKGDLLGGCYGEVKDLVTNKTIAYYYLSNCSGKDYFKLHCNASKLRYYNEKRAEMAGDLATTFLFNKYLPGSEKALPEVMEELKTIPMGPYFWEGVSVGVSFPNKAQIVDQPGHVRSLHIRTHNSMDVMQVKYSDHEGHVVGKPQTVGSSHDFILTKNTNINGLKLGFGGKHAAAGFDVSIIISMEVVFSNGTTSGKCGNLANWSEYFREAIADPSYALYGVQYAGGYGPGHTTGVTLLNLEFIHSSLLPAYNDELDEEGCIKLKWLHVYGENVFRQGSQIPEILDKNSIRKLKSDKLPGTYSIDFYGMPMQDVPGGSHFYYNVTIENKTDTARNIRLGNDRPMNGDNVINFKSGSPAAYGNRSITIEPGSTKTIKAAISYPGGECWVNIHTQIKELNDIKDLPQNANIDEYFNIRTLHFKSEVYDPPRIGLNEGVLITKAACRPEEYKELFKDSVWWSQVNHYNPIDTEMLDLDYVSEFSIDQFIINRVSATNTDGTHLESEITLKIILRDKL